MGAQRVGALQVTGGDGGMNVAVVAVGGVCVVLGNGHGGVSGVRGVVE